eukprot:jgi/Ulvmu1/5002/UM021_0019.1
MGRIIAFQDVQTDAQLAHIERAIMSVPRLCPAMCLTKDMRDACPKARLRRGLLDEHWGALDWDSGMFSSNYMPFPACKLFVTFSTEAEGSTVISALNGRAYPTTVCSGRERTWMWVSSASPVDSNQAVLYNGLLDIGHLFQHCSRHGQVRHIEHVILTDDDPLSETYPSTHTTQVTMATAAAAEALMFAQGDEGLGIGAPHSIPSLNDPEHVVLVGRDLDLPGLPLLDGVAPEIARQYVWRDKHTDLCHRFVKFVSHAARSRFMDYLQAFDPQTLPHVCLYDPKKVPAARYIQKLWCLPTKCAMVVNNLPPELLCSQFMTRVVKVDQYVHNAITRYEYKQRRLCSERRCKLRTRARGRGPQGRARKGKQGRRGKCGRKDHRGRRGKAGRGRRVPRGMRRVGRGPAYSKYELHGRPNVQLVSGRRSAVQCARVYIEAHDAEDYLELWDMIEGLRFGSRKVWVETLAMRRIPGLPQPDENVPKLAVPNTESADSNADPAEAEAGIPAKASQKSCTADSGDEPGSPRIEAGKCVEGMCGVGQRTQREVQQ